MEQGTLVFPDTSLDGKTSHYTGIAADILAIT
jgi:hypothetical protein